MDSSLVSVLSFRCVVKLYPLTVSQLPREHSCTFSLRAKSSVWPVSKEMNFLMDGPTLRLKNVKVHSHQIHKLTTTRMDEGKLSINLSGHFTYNSIIITNASDLSSLRKFRDLLEKALTNDGLSTSDMLKTPPPPSKTPPPGAPSAFSRVSPASTWKSPISTLGSSSHPESESTGHKRMSLKLLSHPNNRRGAAMVEASLAKQSASSKGSLTAPASFYGASSVSSQPFFPSHTPPAALRKTTVQYNPFLSARRNLATDMGDRTTSSENGGEAMQGAGDVRHQTRVHPRRPLSNIATSNRATSPLDFQLDFQSPDGFANLGNTCYMNAVLQSLLGIEPFADDLMNYSLAKRVAPQSLFRMMYLLAKSKRALDSFESQKILLKKIKSAISCGASKFGSYRQQDAHELLGQCLDQLKDDVEELNSRLTSSVPSDAREGTKDLCPVARNFECKILHTITCKNCGKVTTKSEVNYDFALQLPKSVLIRPNEQANLQQLLDLYFNSEEVEYSCVACNGKMATLTHQLSKLPRIMILHLKRYGYNAELSKNSKRVDNIRIPRSINIDDMCVDNSTPPHVFDKSLASDMIPGSMKVATPTSSNVTTPTPLNVAAPTPLNVTTPTPGDDEMTVIPESPKAASLGGHSPNKMVGDDSDHTPTCSPNKAYGKSHTPSPSSNAACHTSQNHSCSNGHAPSPSHKTAHANGQLVALGKRRSSERYVSIATSPQTSPCGSKVSKHSADSTVSKKGRGVACESAEVSNGNSSYSCLLGGDELAKVADSDEFDEMAQSSQLFDFLDEDTPTPATTTDSHSSSRTSSRFHSGSSVDTSALDSTSARAVRGNSSSSEPVTTPTNHHSDTNMSEEDSMMKAVEESLKNEPNDFQLLHQMGLSEEEQLNLAMELSIQEASSSMSSNMPMAPPPPSIPDDGNGVLPSQPIRSSLEMQTYRLVGVVSHIGRGSAGGHYISDVCSLNDKTWKTYNDSYVCEVREEHVRQNRQTTGYIFFYMHRSVVSSVSQPSNKT